MKILVTGSAGFIGYFLVDKLLKDTVYEVVGLDNLNEYYSVDMKYARLQLHGIESKDICYDKLVQSTSRPRYRFIKIGLEDETALNKLCRQEKFDCIVNLAAQAGVRYSLSAPSVYIESNIKGFLNLLEACRHYPVKHFVYASSSSVYGLNSSIPFSVSHPVNHPISLYAATKKSDELMAHVYSHLFNIPSTGLRFFTVYGPWGRPDMALFLFTKSILEGKPIEIFNNGNMLRDFTYVEDIAEGILRVINHPATPDPQFNALQPDPSISSAPYRIYNIGNQHPIKLLDFIETLEKHLGKEAIKKMLPIQPGDVPSTMADVTSFQKTFNFIPKTNINAGIENFVIWYRSYFKKENI